MKTISRSFGLLMLVTVLGILINFEQVLNKCFYSANISTNSDCNFSLTL